MCKKRQTGRKMRINHVKMYSKFVITFMFLIIITLSGCAKEKVSSDDLVKDETETITSEVESSTLDTEENVVSAEVSMEEAISIGIEEASKYYDDLYLTEIHSYDNDQNPSISAGIDGKRHLWYVDFANDKLNYVSIFISDGKIEQVEHYDNNGNSGLIDLTEIKISGEEAVRKAQEMGLKGGDPSIESDWVSGFNFKMSYGSLVETPDKRQIFLEVIGISPNGNFAHIDFDASTGEIILMEEEVVLENEEVEWKPFDIE